MDIDQLDLELEKQNGNINILHECLKSIDNYIQDMRLSDDTQDILELLRQVKSNLDSCKKNVKTIKFLKTHYDDYTNGELKHSELITYNRCLNEYDEAIELTSNSISKFLVKYSNFFHSLEENEVEFETKKTVKMKTQKKAKNKFEIKVDSEKRDNSTYEIIDTQGNDSKIKKLNEEESVDNISSTMNEYTDELHDNNILFISEKKNKIFLPYTIEEVTNILESSDQYINAEDVIKNEFTLPLDKHKNGVFSRFKETFRFMRKKDKASIMDSLDFAIDLAYNFKLNSAIILACKNYEQLDTYLDCLELNELSKFDYFKIEYEINPAKR